MTSARHITGNNDGLPLSMVTCYGNSAASEA